MESKEETECASFTAFVMQVRQQIEVSRKDSLKQQESYLK